MVFIQYCSPLSAVDLDQVKLAPKHPGSRPILTFATFLTSRCSFSSRHAILIRLVFFGSTVTTRQRQCVWPSIVRISVSTAARIGPADILSFSFSAIFEVSIVQSNVSVSGVGVVFDVESVPM